MTTDICGKGYVSAFCVPTHYIDDMYIGINKPSTFFTEVGHISARCAFRRAGSSRPKFNLSRQMSPPSSTAWTISLRNGGCLFPSLGSGRSSIRMPTFPPRASECGRTLFESPQATKHHRRVPTMPQRYQMLSLYAEGLTLTGVFKVLGLGDADYVEVSAFCFRAGRRLRAPEDDRRLWFCNKLARRFLEGFLRVWIRCRALSCYKSLLVSAPASGHELDRCEIPRRVEGMHRFTLSRRLHRVSSSTGPTSVTVVYYIVCIGARRALRIRSYSETCTTKFSLA